ncbi:carboxypeptidase-like regulatory domain-containing protein [Polaribacter sp. BAL334]|uniref:TonB-dependent receptor n=1 Tax=Polaribacter sp. BAL334 TaxID=1708178 RepID=UPI0018D25209|nr:carboxypeptidase-like regulatory domain-containing protein [Polaribacter sp. BAL334]MBG7613651.1 carboxypeptidase-like regulatory domain-containing protein [Polaribacter sp. BAL334]
MKNFKNVLFVALFLITATVLGQTKISGIIVDETNQPLPGASILEKGTKNGTETNFDGKFTLEAKSKSGVLVISYIGYKSREVAFNSSSANVGTLKLRVDENSLEEVVIIGKGVIDLSGGRTTPVAVSTIKAAEIQKKIGTQDVTMALVNTPSIYVSGQAGGFGDSRISVRGFDQTNTAFLLNGQPINGMEDGRMYWSNWSGVNDIASAVQIQRGLGASKLAISSVGGTMNFVTKTTDKEEGGSFYVGTANDSYIKTTAMYNTGVSKSGWGTSVMLSHWQGNGYNNGTRGQGQTYFISFGYKPNENHNFNFLITGAPQWHDQNFTKRISDYLTNGYKFNNNYGFYQGEYLSERRNFYHKPVINLNWDYQISDASSLSTVVYASFGRGGGTGNYGRSAARIRTADGLIDYDAIFANNSAKPNGEGTFGNNAYATRASMNLHSWYGVVSNFEHKINDNLTWNIGADLRTYYGTHFRQISNFHGLTSWTEDRRLRDGSNLTTGNPISNTVTETGKADPWVATFNTMAENQRIDYDNSERISYAGLFTQLEYANDFMSAFFQGSVSNQSHQRFDRYDYLPEFKDSPKVSNAGYNLKFGASFKVTDASTIYMNTGYYSRQPYHDNIFNNFTNAINPSSQNEKIFGLELGYNFKSEFFSGSVNLYSTSWKDRINGFTNVANNVVTITETTGQSQLHKGIEFDFVANITSQLKLKGFASIGDWKYVGELISRQLDENRNVISEAAPVNVDGINVGDAAQTSYGLGIDYTIIENLSVDSDFRFYDRLFSNVSPTRGELQLPSYGLLDMGVSYRLNLGKSNSKSLDFRANVNNVLDRRYISELTTANQATSGATLYRGINVTNNGFFGWGRTWNASVRYNF